MRKGFQLLFCLISFSLFSNTSNFTKLLKTIEKQNTKWKLLELNSKKTKLEIESTKNYYLPEWILGDGVTPLYSVSEQNELLNHTIGLNTGINWWTPTDGTLSFMLNDLLTISESEDDYIYSQTPSISMTFSQPTYLNKKFIDASAYANKKYIELQYPKLKEELHSILNRNRLIIDFVTELNSIRKSKRELSLKSNELKILILELEQLEISKNSGTISEHKYWDKLLDKEQLEEVVWDLDRSYSLKYTRLLNSNGLNDLPNQIYPNISVTLTDNFKNSHLMKLQELENKQSLLNISLSNKTYSSNIQASFSISPQYGERENTSDFKESFNFNTDGSSISWSASLLYTLSSSKLLGNKLHEDIYSTRLLENKMLLDEVKEKVKYSYGELKNKHELLLERKERITSSFTYIKDMYKGEELKLRSGNITKLDLDNIALRVKERENFLLSIQDEIFLTELQLLSLTGEDLFNYNYQQF